MHRLIKILSITFIVLLSYTNIGLLYNINHGLHAHIIANNQILIHYHNCHKNKDKHHCNDCNPNSAATNSTTLTFIRSFCIISFKELSHPINAIRKRLFFIIVYSFHLNTHLLRAPPFLL